MKKYAGEEFLNKIYQDLVNSDIVKHTSKGRNKNEDVHIYMDRLEKIHNDALNHNKTSLLKKLYYDKYVIKSKNVPESYFKQQEQIALDRGYGYIHYDEYEKQKEINNIITEQKESLDAWIDYFSSFDADMYPTWFKYYCFQGMIRIGYFDKQTNKYTKRTDSTIKPFIEIDREAIALVYDELIKTLNKEKIDDEKLQQLLNSGSFSKIYAYAIKKLDSYKKSSFDSDKGIWKKYLQGSNPNILFNDIHGKGTGWCTAGGIETAKLHLSGGDFYVYYTMDENNNFTNPRIAIRMEYGKIAEIRGVAENQNIEPGMEKVIEKKLEEFPDKDEYRKKVKDMELLTCIYNKYQNNNELTQNELRFLYEIDSKIIGFGYRDDPRIEEIIYMRNKRKDLAAIFNCNENQISFTSPEVLSGNIVCHYSSYLNLIQFTSGNGLKLPYYSNCTVDLRYLKSANGLVLPNTINGDLYLNSLTNGEGLVLPNAINGTLFLDSLTNVHGLIIHDNLDCKLFCPIADNNINELKQMCKSDYKKI